MADPSGIPSVSAPSVTAGDSVQPGSAEVVHPPPDGKIPAPSRVTASGGGEQDIQPQPRSIPDRIFSTLEHGWLQLMLGVVSVFFGIVDGRYISIISVLLPLAIHRSGSVKGLTRRVQSVVYFASFCLLFFALWKAGGRWNKERDNSPLIKAIADRVGGTLKETVGKIMPGGLIQPSGPDKGTVGGNTKPVARQSRPNAPNPRLQLISDAREMADKLTNIHTQMRADLERVQQDIDWDIAASPRDKGHEDFARKAHAPDDATIRNDVRLNTRSAASLKL